VSDQQEQPVEETREAAGPPAPTSVATPGERTGHPVVDDVLVSMDSLEARPLSEQVAVLDAAHERLRGALAEAGSPPTTLPPEQRGAPESSAG
jgi:hypothetical protein